MRPSGMRAIRRRFFLIMTPSALAVIAPIVGYVAWSQHADAVARLTQRIERIAQAQSLIVAPMMRRSDAAIVDVVGAVIVDPEVVGVAVFDLEEEPLEQLGVDGAIAGADAIVATQPINYGDRAGLHRLGRIEVVASRKALDQAFMRQLATAAAAALGATAIAAVCAGLTYRQMASKPLRQLSNAIEASRSGRFPQEAPWRSDDEFGAVVAAFNAMQRDRQRFLKELDAARERADDAIRAQEALYANATHELRTPLHLIMGFAELLMADPATRTRAQEEDYLQQIRESGAQMLAYVENVFLAARAQSGALTLDQDLVDVGDLVRHAVDARAEDAQSARVSLAFTPPEPAVEGVYDQMRLRRAIDILLARVVRLAMPDTAIPIAVRRENDGAVCIFIGEDDGGDDAALAARLRDGPRKRIGPAPADFQGLALAVATLLVERHGGAVAGGDRRIVVFLPASTAPALAAVA